jgi:hypothetical protein
MLANDFVKTTKGKESATIISYDIYNNFTEESIITYLNKTYGCAIESITGDPAWYGRGTVVGSGVDKIPAEWEEALSEGFTELELIEEE